MTNVEAWRGTRYSFVDVERRESIVLALAAVAVLALVLLRWRGLLATFGVLLSLLLLLKFVVPALLDGRPAILAALVGSLAVMLVTVTTVGRPVSETLWVCCPRESARSCAHA